MPLIVREREALKRMNGESDDYAAKATALVRGIAASGYAIGDRSGFRIHSEDLDRSMAHMVHDSLVSMRPFGLTVLKDTSKVTRAIASSGIPGFRIMRGRAEIVGDLSIENAWRNPVVRVTAYGGDDPHRMWGVMEALAASNGIELRLDKVSAFVGRERYFRPKLIRK